MFFIISSSVYHLDLHSFPTRRSSDLFLLVARDAAKLAAVAADLRVRGAARVDELVADLADFARDRKSTRLNSSHSQISYAVFCLQKKKITKAHIEISAAV